MPDRRGVEAVIGILHSPTRKYAEAHGHDVDVGSAGRVLHGRVQVRHVIAVGLDYQDLGPRCEGVGPFHVDTLLRVQPEYPGPATALGLPPEWLTTVGKLVLAVLLPGPPILKGLIELLDIVADVGVVMISTMAMVSPLPALL